MTDAFKDIHNLVCLLSAESEQVRKAVTEELRGQVSSLQAYLDAVGDSLDPSAQFQIHELLREQAHVAMRSNWLSWTRLGSEHHRLEQALDFLARTFDHGREWPSLALELDKLAAEFLKASDETSVDALNKFLFVSGRFRGADKQTFYEPHHSNLCHVLRHGIGLPISLALIMILLGYRLGLNIQGFNLPGRFLVRVRVSGKVSLIDCYDGGKHLADSDIAALSLSPQVSYQKLLDEPPTATDIISRVLVNLVNAFHRAGNMSQHFLAQELLADLRNHLSGKTAVVPDGRVTFKRGQVVRHRNYGYRGVIVELDLTCQADEKWYQANRTQPDRNQPWYHVLVDGSTVATYAAQVNLEPDKNPAEIKHPLVPLYFQGFKNGVYHRNEVPWSFS